VVYHGGVLSTPVYADAVTAALAQQAEDFAVREPASDAVHGALSYARKFAAD
jgi:hypothetical protein